LALVTPSQILARVIGYCEKTTDNMRRWMESNPNDIQPKDAKNYPGKVDHTTCIVLRVGPARFEREELFLDNLVVRIRHPSSGVNEESEGTQQVSFKGSDLLHWLKKNSISFHNYNSPEDVAQLLMSFGYMTVVTSSDSFTYETFHPEALYRFTISEPILNKKDWEILTLGALKRTYKKDELIVEERSNLRGVYQLVRGSCRMEMSERRFTKTHPGDVVKSDTIGTLGVPETFGEASILWSGSSPVSVIANEDVDVFFIEVDYLRCMFIKFPEMAGRFYQFLGSILSKRVYHVLSDLITVKQSESKAIIANVSLSVPTLSSSNHQ